MDNSSYIITCKNCYYGISWPVIIHIIQSSPEFVEASAEGHKNHYSIYMGVGTTGKHFLVVTSQGYCDFGTSRWGNFSNIRSVECLLQSICPELDSDDELTVACAVASIAEKCGIS